MNKNDDKLINPYSNHALHEAHRAWVPDYINPYNLILTFANDVSEEYARKMYSQFIVKISKQIYKNAAKDSRGKKRIPQRGYLEENESERLHIHNLIDVRDDWDERIIKMVHMLWGHGLVIKSVKVPIPEVPYVHRYNSKMKTKRDYSDSYLVVD